METQSPFRLLIVCTGNICRSPLAERLLQTGFDRISSGAVTVSSAGTKAAVGEGMSPFSAEIATGYGVSADGFTARQLTTDVLEGAGLVLTMTTKHRGEVIRLDPGLLRKTFTFREFARLLNALDPRLPAPALGAEGNVRFWEELPAKAASVRHLVLGNAASENDVLDPYGLDRDAYKQMEKELMPSLMGLLRFTAKHAPGSSHPELLLPIETPAPPAKNSASRFKGWGRNTRKAEEQPAAAASAKEQAGRSKPGAAAAASGAAGVLAGAGALSGASALAGESATAAGAASATAAPTAAAVSSSPAKASVATLEPATLEPAAPAPAETASAGSAAVAAAAVGTAAVGTAASRPAPVVTKKSAVKEKAASSAPAAAAAVVVTAPKTLPSEPVQPKAPREQPERSAGGKGKKRTARLVLGGAAMLVAVSAALAGAYVFNLAKTFDEQTIKIDSAFPDESTRPQEPAPVNGKTPLNFLVIGSDSLKESTGEAEKGEASNQRSDTLMLVHIPADRKKVFSISLMRDLWVKIPGRGESKINAALAHGGVPLTVQTVESILHQRIDHVVMVDVAGFNRVTDAVGGVELDVKVPFTSTILNGHVFDKGKVKMNGPEALAFVRERQAFPDGDYQRVKNQQTYMQGLFDKVSDPKTFLDPLKITNMVTVMSPFVSVDKGLNALAVAEIATELHEIRPSSIAMFTLPTGGIGTSKDGQSIVLTDPKAIKGISDALTADKLDQYLAKNPVKDRPQGS